LDGDIQAVRGMGHLILSLSGLLVAIATLPILLWLFIRSTQHRLPATAIFCGQLAVRTAYLFGLADLEPFAPFDFTLLAVNFSALMYAIALFGFRIFDPVPMARRIVIEQMSEGMLVLDTQDQIVDLNPAAEKILGISKSRACGCQVNKVLPISPNPTARPADSNATQFPLWDALRAEITLGSDNAVRYYALHLSSLKEQRGLTIGSLILLHDVTEQTHARAQLLEQQRALAMADERERLARELHDSVGQVLAYTSLELETARQLLEQGQTANVNGQLGRLARIIQNTHADVREQILNLRVAPSTEQSLVTTLKEYLDGYTQNYGVVTDLVLGGALDGGAFKPEAQMQLFRIIQEALSNARKHGNARRVQIKFGIEDNLACVTIQDDGGGFDPTQENDTEKKHFGLQFMRERAEHLGGGLVVDSMPGKGTRVVVKVPVKQ
jgi:PAS domain S-box-containing protein